MKVVSDGIQNGIIADEYGKHGSQFNENGMPTCSLPFEILDPPEGTKSFALLLEDKDAYPVTPGFSWVHWLAADITRTRLMADESRTAADFVQGANSWISPQGGSQSRELSSCYGGMAPPNEPHIYELHVYALDTLLGLENGFLLHELFRRMEGHILAQATLKGEYRN